jgi:hypothetical protein
MLEGDLAVLDGWVIQDPRRRLLLFLGGPFSSESTKAGERCRAPY